MTYRANLALSSCNVFTVNKLCVVEAAGVERFFHKVSL
jgi:hypothetical protein